MTIKNELRNKEESKIIFWRCIISIFIFCLLIMSFVQINYNSKFMEMSQLTIKLNEQFGQIAEKINEGEMELAKMKKEIMSTQNALKIRTNDELSEIKNAVSFLLQPAIVAQCVKPFHLCSP